MQLHPPASTQTKTGTKVGHSRVSRKSRAKDTLHLKPKADVTDASANASELNGKIALAAYFLAEGRGFAPGHELDDWLSAERHVLASG